MEIYTYFEYLLSALLFFFFLVPSKIIFIILNILCFFF